MIVPPKFDQPPREITHHKALREMPFKGVVGAINGTLISVTITEDDKTPCRGRGRGECFQNVMIICDFNMIFIYVVAGWEGVVHGAMVLSETLGDDASSSTCVTPSTSTTFGELENKLKMDLLVSKTKTEMLESFLTEIGKLNLKD
ncbi:hypothetical protein GIB67_038047 [Kingdonia uniflora]|uniref:Uncharacterized protein n=1 Tax=Kingdonia uniflora TaxID=39325 RepID=A0A7J7MCB5_9MAGN|nr:hypothetical protein GIB67_038047 [Kingdonia uniflora]